MASSDSNAKLVLVVDDSPIDRRLVRGLLERRLGCEVVEADRAAAALSVLESRPPSMVVTDLTMPGMTGLELVKEVKQRLPLTPVILMTGRGSEEVAVAALQAGAASYVPKKRLARDLADTVASVMAAAEEAATTGELARRIRSMQYAYELENDLSLISAMVGHLAGQVEGMWSLGKMGCVRVRVALEEAMTNAMFHGNLECDSSMRDDDDEAYRKLAAERAATPPFSERRIRVTATVDGESAVFRIADEGVGFDPASLPDPTDPDYLDRSHGRGVMLMRAFMDEVVYSPTGNEVTLTKHRHSMADLELTLDAE